MPKKFNPAPFRERMGFAQVIDLEEGFHEPSSLAPSSAQSILEQVDFSGPPIKGAKVDFLAKSHENYFSGGTTEQKITLGSQITFQEVRGPNLASVSPDATDVKVQRVKTSARALERTSQEFKAELPTGPLELLPSLPKTRALSTKSVTQLEATDARRSFFAREREAQAVPTRLNDELAAKVATDLSSRIESPFSAEDLEQQARFNQMSLFLEPKLVAELDAPFHWWRAVKMLEPIRSSLGTAYRPMLVIVSLASSVGRSAEDLERLSQTLGAEESLNEGRRDSVFFAALWEVAVITGITPDYLRKVLARHSSKLRRIKHHHDWKTETTFTGEKQVFIAGCLFRVRWPSSGEQYNPDILRGSKTKTVYKALINRKAVYRDLDADVFEGHTEQAYRNEGKVSSNPLGAVKNVTRSSELPAGFALELLTYCMGRIKGLTGYTVSDVQRYGTQIERINALVNLLESPVSKGHNKLENWVRAVANLLCGTLEEGNERHVKGWLHVCWTLYRTGKVVWLLQAVWDVLVRASDLGSIRSKGAMVRAMLNKRGFLELREALEEQRAA